MDCSELTSRASLRIFGPVGRDERVDGLRAVATTREDVDVATGHRQSGTIVTSSILLTMGS